MSVPNDSLQVTSNDCNRSWLSGWMRWVPTSLEALQEAEKRVLSYVKHPYKGEFVNVSSAKLNSGSTEDLQVWTVSLNTEHAGGKLPLVLMHGFASGVALWSLNLDAFSVDRPVYAFDLLGFGRSSRPSFSGAAHEAEHQLVQSVEAWREKMGLERFILLGHSMGGFLATSYALQHPQRVAHLILADPWGFPDHPPANAPHHYPMPTWVRLVATMLQPFNPLAGLRMAGPWGPRLVDRFRPDLKRKFETLVEDTEAISNYIYHCNAQVPSGEAAFKAMTARFGWAKHPMMNRMNDLHEDVPITFIYGSKSWVDRQPGLQIKCMRHRSYVDIQVIQGAGHHVYADRPSQFHSLVQRACQRVDEGLDQGTLLSPSGLTQKAEDMPDIVRGTEEPELSIESGVL